MDDSSCIIALSIALLSFFVSTTGTESSICKLSEFKCTNGTCISISKYCDGHNDCFDKSDEPKLCSGKSNYLR